MAGKSVVASAPASLFFSPSTNQSAVACLKVTVLSVTPKPAGGLGLYVSCGDIAFDIDIPALPGRPDFTPGDRLLVEFPKGSNPLTTRYTAIYPASSTSKQPTSIRNETMSAIARITMTSLELVDYINSERKEKALQAGAEFPSKGHAKLEHSDFLKKVLEVLGECAGNFSGTYKVEGPNGGTRDVPCYTFPKREACLMAMSYSYDLQAKVFDRMTALEQQALQWGAKTALPVVALPKPTREFKDYYSVAKLIGLDKNAAAIAANQAVVKLTGTNVLALMDQTQIEADRQDTQWFTPTELGQRINVSARSFNLLLAEAGLQLKRGEVWEVTDAGREFARLYDTGKKHGSGVPVQQIKWSPAVLPLLEKEAA